MQLNVCTNQLSAACLLAGAVTGCTTFELEEDGSGGSVRVGAFSSFSSAQDQARRICGLEEGSSFDPIPESPYLPVITHTVHFFSCTESEKDIQ